MGQTSHAKSNKRGLINKYSSLKSASTTQWNHLQDDKETVIKAFPNLSRFFGIAERNPSSSKDSDFTCMILQPTRLSFCHTESVDWVDDGGTRITSLEHDDFENDTMVFVNSLLNKGPIHRNHRNDVPYTRYIDQMTGLDWAALLCIRPGVASACAWEKLDGKAFCLLMINRPSFREHCDWSKFGGLEWSVLLAENPEFVKNCDTHNGWSKFSDEDWQYLLDERPWMAKFKSTPVSTPEA